VEGEQKGKVEAAKKGTYFLIWDNTYSMLKKKTFTYEVSIIKPKSNEK